ncbi:MAG TPA: ABC transporter ATP-binding protein [Candidatus Scybalocola faecavium]|nr:ABC transporter ATP-binding protein [Candidatus Scybalocola faecavium]
MIEIKDLKKSYGSFTLDCSLSVAPGMITGLIGQNGAGKTTTFKALLGLIRPDGGTVSIMGQDPQSMDGRQKEKIGVVLSDSGFSGYLTVKDIIPVLNSLYHRFDRQYFIRQCQNFSLPMDKKIKDFSTGMKAKLKVLAAISHKANVLILDEPTAGLDVVARDEVLDLLRNYMEMDETNCIFISSHISTDLEGLCDDLYMIHQGRIILHEDTDVLLDKYGILKVDEEQFKCLDSRYILKTMKESYGYRCLTGEKQFYAENYPGIVIENSSIDDVILFMSRGNTL